MQLSAYENRHGGFDLKPADSTLAMAVASARTKEAAEEIAKRYNSHEALVSACKDLNGLVIVRCADCEGSGIWPNGHQEACHTCGGVGENVEGHFHPDELRAIRAALVLAGGAA